ncbi:N-acetyl sugar amidotransferase [Gammaproteobacteria bacterium]|nr:N-acetyl sugar amidotransferase [Gammaproteobacteria bacterium]
MTVTLCKRCVNPLTRPNVYIDEEGICGVCRLFEDLEKGLIDWSVRDSEIEEIKEWGKRNTKSSYDCIVTVSGGKDSMRQAFFARDELGMNPLLVSAIYPPEETSERGPKNLSNLVEHGFDCISVGVNPEKFKYLMQQCFKNYFNLFNASEMALYSIPIHVAIAEKIPLIFLGENPAHTIGEKHGKLDGDASQMRKSNTIMGGNAGVFLDEQVSSQDLHFYNYPPNDDVEYAGLRIVYLGYYIRDWSGWNNGEFSIERGLVIRDDDPENTGDLWGISALDEDFRIVNQLMKFVKFGFGHVTDQTMERIHAGEMRRDEAIELIKKYDGKCSNEYIEKLCHYLKIKPDDFHKKLDANRNMDIWEKESNNEWKLKVKY